MMLLSASRKTAHSHLVRHVSAKAAETVDVLIVGGGVVGTGMAASLQNFLPHLSVRVLEAGPRKAPVPLSSVPHPRSYALSPASLQFLQLQNDESSTLQQLGYYKRMQVWEARQPAFLSFGVDDLPASSSNTNQEWLGAVTEDSFLVQELSSRLAPDTIQYETTVSDLQLPSHAAKGLAKVQLHHNGMESTVQCQLVVAADGGNSQIRKMLGIASRVHEYGETALTCTVEISESMQQRAFQRFCSLEDGILALLPTRSDRHAIVVWSIRPEQVMHWKGAPSAQLVEHLNQLLQRGPERLDPLFTTSESSIPIVSNIQYGAEKIWEMIQYGSTLASLTRRQASAQSFQPPPLLLQIASPLFSFPLQLRQVSRYTAPRVALVGDAAHTVHPMAGQGLNLGIQDVQSLVEHMQKADDAGMDIATFLEDGYEPCRQRQVMATVQGIHALHQMFRNPSTVMQHMKTLGMNFVQNVPPVRSLLVQAACGGVGR